MSSYLNSYCLTVGLPLFNSSEKLKGILDNLLNQSFKDFNLIISDNCSTDNTALICKEYSEKHSNISYKRQDQNIGVTNNFAYVLELSKTKYFMWAADDDFRSPNYILRNLEFLELNPTYIGSGSSFNFNNCQEINLIKTPSLVGDTDCRVMTILENCWKSNGYSFSIYRTEALKSYKSYRCAFLANDWARLVFLSTLGNINVLNKEFIICGSSGISNSPRILSIYAEERIERYVPFYIFTKYVINLSKNFSISTKYCIYVKLAIINIKGIYLKIKSICTPKFYKPFKSLARLIRKSLWLLIYI